MKKVICLILIALCIILSGCDKKSDPIEGTWMAKVPETDLLPILNGVSDELLSDFTSLVKTIGSDVTFDVYLSFEKDGYCTIAFDKDNITQSYKTYMLDSIQFMREGGKDAIAQYMNSTVEDVDSILASDNITLEGFYEMLESQVDVIAKEYTDMVVQACLFELDNYIIYGEIQYSAKDGKIEFLQYKDSLDYYAHDGVLTFDGKMSDLTVKMFVNNKWKKHSDDVISSNLLESEDLTK